MNSSIIRLENYIDISSLLVMFFVAMWFMANKKIESWIFWIVGDLITIPLYAYRGIRNVISAIFNFYNFSNSRI